MKKDPQNIKYYSFDMNFFFVTSAGLLKTAKLLQLNMPQSVFEIHSIHHTSVNRVRTEGGGGERGLIRMRKI